MCTSTEETFLKSELFQDKGFLIIGGGEPNLVVNGVGGPLNSFFSGHHKNGWKIDLGQKKILLMTKEGKRKT